MDECGICRGRRTIRLPFYRPVVLEDVAGFSLPADVDALSREYPCPECCSGSYVPFTRLGAIKEKVEGNAVYSSDPRFMESMRRGVVVAMADRMLRDGFVTFEQSAPDYRGYFTLRGTAGVVHPRHVAKFEERVAERQFEVAAALIEQTESDINIWGSHYRVDEVKKSQAIAWLREAFNKVRRKYGDKGHG